MKLRIVAISDTHEQHEQIELPAGDVLICAGDITFNGRPQAIAAFNRWFSSQPHRFKILVAGNHDFLFEENSAAARDLLPDEIIYLEDSGCTLDVAPPAKPLAIWGSPITPWFFNWAFNRHRGEPIRRHWEKIPVRTDILITHGPPAGILDRNRAGEPTGCEDLRRTIDRIKPRLHVFGHIHEGYGVEARDGTIFVNACLLDERYRLAHAPVVVDLDL
ncbi:MAG TPA: metallophosphatase domain-containing protein [Blastocatellia bacterium]|nr:metallophosphatase domain-containing protein [Blastocatellia bacterium]